MTPPREDCGMCHGTGVVYDWVPYGMGNVRMPTGCECCDDDEPEPEPVDEDAA